MRNRRIATAYAVFCTLLLVGGGVVCFAFAYQDGIDSMIECIAGLLVGVVLAPIFHELGHVAFAKMAKMQLVYVKTFCFAWIRRGKKLHFRLVSPFAPDETQVIPNTGADIRSRAVQYTLGGLIFSGIVWTVLLVASVLVTVLAKPNFELWGMSVYTGYLFLLNVLPLEYGSGKTDALVYRGIKKGYDAEKVMLSAMYIQGEIFAGKSYGEIDETYYFDLPVLAEDEPLFAILCELRYRYLVDKERFDESAKYINRLAGIQEYLTDEQMQRVCAELVFMHALNGDLERAEECAKPCKAFLSAETATAKRVLATFTFAFGEKDKAQTLKETGLALLQDEWIAGERLWEEKLLSRLQS
ncbi:MAG: hypothetical protein IJ996_05110 [Clostridia bacterium]|nr:hypothetical protein [Clostridia bacterium]